MLIKLCHFAVLLCTGLFLAGCRDSLIAFSSARNGNFEIWTVDINGENACSLTESKGHDFSPCWSPDGRKIVFYSTRDQVKINKKDYNTEIYSMYANGTGVTRLTYNKYADIAPSFSPKGDKIAFCSDRKEKLLFGLFIMNPDGTDQKIITSSTNVIEKSPDWLNNDFLVFERTYINMKGMKQCNLFMINKNGSDLRQITNSDYQDHTPSCSRDGSKIVFTRIDGTRHSKIYIINSDSTKLKRLTHDDFYNDEGPSWSPDGQKIVFSSWRGKRHLYIINIDGTNLHEALQPCPLDDIDPCWSPF
ncbi:MAG: hypothetical protein ABRQ38_20750 [Candidatus Eremiobacterota bacterium]